MTEVVGTRKIAIIGAGLMGTWHAHAVRRLGGRLAAVVDPNEPAARKLAAAAGAPIYASVEALLAGQAIDAAHLCTPPATHGPLSRQLIDAGVDLLVEKPFGATAAEAGELLDLAAAAGRQICPVYQLPFQRGMTRALAWLPAIGRPVHWRFAVRSAGAAGLPAAETEAIMRDILPHPLSVLAAAMPGSLPAVAWQAAAPASGEFHALGQFEGGTITLEISMAARPTANLAEITGPGGTIHLDFFHGFAFREPAAVSRWRKIGHPFDRAGRRLTAAGSSLGRRLLTREPAYPGLKALIRRFYEAAAGRAPAPYDGLTIRQIAAAHEQLLARVSSPSSAVVSPFRGTGGGGR